MKKAHYHVVNEAVAEARKEWGPRLANFINALLRRYVRERETIQDREDRPLKKGGKGSEALIEQLSVNYSYPAWLVDRWLRRFGERKCEELLNALNQTPDFTLRIDERQTDMGVVAGLLERAGTGWKKGVFLDSAIHVDRLASLLQEDLFKKGIISVQDESSQLAGMALQAGDGHWILDACAGLGTKSLQIKGLAPNSFVVSMDRDIRKMRSVKRRILAVAGDATQPPFRTGLFDTILVDAPCSSLGIIRKHPEIKWRREEKDILDWGLYQRELLKSLWPCLKPGGHMVYSVCSFEPEETLDVIERLKGERGFVLENPLPFLFDKDYFLSVPDESGLDGFFIARLRKI